eukprot:3736212-Prymnesium_polylepis.1
MIDIGASNLRRLRAVFALGRSRRCAHSLTARATFACARHAWKFASDTQFSRSAVATVRSRGDNRSRQRAVAARH